jgi:monovalent cation:H+ antiporter, CPA1 family
LWFNRGPHERLCDCGMEPRRLAALPALAELPAAELAELAAVMTEVEIEAGTALMTFGKDGYVIYFVERGEADAVTGIDEVAHALGPGDMFGEIAVLVTGQRTATVVARSRMVLVALFELDFQGIRKRVPEFERSLRRVGSERLGAETQS